MKIGIVGLGHLGMTTASCMATVHDVIAYDHDDAYCKEPINEPGLAALLAQGIGFGKILLTTDKSLLKHAELIWVTFDTPVSNSDDADVIGVIEEINSLMPVIQDGITILISSQLPVGTIAGLEKQWKENNRRVYFVAAPENLRRGRAIETFMNPDRIVLGTREDHIRGHLKSIWPFDGKVEWMSIESAEMTKHALNAYLATSIVFANEIAALCRQTGVDPREVERGLKTDARVGQYAYVRAGEAFTGGTLGRDLRYLQKMSEQHRDLFYTIYDLNQKHLMEYLNAK